MKQVQTKGFWTCALVCVGGCLTCISDGPVIIVDFVSGGTALTTGSQDQYIELILIAECY